MNERHGFVDSNCTLGRRNRGVPPVVIMVSLRRLLDAAAPGRVPHYPHSLFWLRVCPAVWVWNGNVIEYGKCYVVDEVKIDG